MITVRKINEEDALVLAQFEKEIALISFGEDAITDLEFHAKKIKKSMAKERDGMLVLDVEGKVCGWLWMALKINSVSEDKYINFKSFYISEDYRGSDSVNMLFDAGMAYCKEMNVKSVVGKVNACNLPMRVLYKKYGFKPTHITMEYNF